MDIVGARYSSNLTTSCLATSLSGANLIRFLLDINLEARLVAGNQNAGNRKEASCLCSLFFFLFNLSILPFSFKVLFSTDITPQFARG